ncbi:hypothetical protein Cgig2_021593 [Carnegiea gigantea]|uniref:DUF4283 domain-containing protein n=1 Tax=Carnegiea gigantea TaxID=171969 RepID=A0A9Q1GKB3_9CARY|nr:hypothetical protein Cgig2_021593 [Carnegiea gigantea]
MAGGGRRGCLKQLSGSVSPSNNVAAQTDAIDQVLNTIQEVNNETVPTEIEQARLHMRESHQREAQLAYAAMTDSNEGTSLNFFQTPVVNGVKCAKIKSKDVQPEIEYWKSAVLCSVLGANPPLEVIEGFIKRIWKTFEIDKICLVKKGSPFPSLNLSVVKPWNEEMDINTETLASLPIWVRFLELDIKYWGLDSLSKIGSVLGIPIQTNKYIRDKSFVKYARLLIEFRLKDNFP